MPASSKRASNEQGDGEVPKPKRRKSVARARTGKGSKQTLIPKLSPSPSPSKLKDPPVPHAQAPMKSPSTPNQPNEFDAVLGEAKDLLGAAAESQALGRLKMASAYLLLLHARLVGLGKRFDRAIISDECPAPNNSIISPPSSQPPTELSGGSKLISPSEEPDTASPRPANNTPTLPKKDAPSSSTAAAKLAKFMPQGIDLDTTMMEHLARAAMELHNKRTGKKPSSAQNQQSQYPPGRIAWTDEEHRLCIAAEKNYGKSDTASISKAIGSRSESEVRARLRNVREKEKLDRDFLGEDVEVAVPKKKGGKGKRPPPRAMNTNAYEHFDAKLMILKGAKKEDWR